MYHSLALGNALTVISSGVTVFPSSPLGFSLRCPDGKKAYVRSLCLDLKELIRPPPACWSWGSSFWMLSGEWVGETRSKLAVSFSGYTLVSREWLPRLNGGSSDCYGLNCVSPKWYVVIPVLQNVTSFGSNEGYCQCNYFNEVKWAPGPI